MRLNASPGSKKCQKKSPKWTRTQKWVWHLKVPLGTFGVLIGTFQVPIGNFQVPIGTNPSLGLRALKSR